jgi:hypothetical protein
MKFCRNGCCNGVSARKFEPRWMLSVTGQPVTASSGPVPHFGES